MSTAAPVNTSLADASSEVQAQLKELEIQIKRRAPDLWTWLAFWGSLTRESPVPPRGV